MVRMIKIKPPSSPRKKYPKIGSKSFLQNPEYTRCYVSPLQKKLLPAPIGIRSSWAPKASKTFMRKNSVRSKKLMRQRILSSSLTPQNLVPPIIGRVIQYILQAAMQGLLGVMRGFEGGRSLLTCRLI